MKEEAEAASTEWARERGLDNSVCVCVCLCCYMRIINAHETRGRSHRRCVPNSVHGLGCTWCCPWEEDKEEVEAGDEWLSEG